MKISLTDAAYDILKAAGTGMPFAELFAEAADTAGIAEDQRKRKKSSLYSQLSMDERFTQLSGNVWDLKENYLYQDTHITVDQVDDDEDEETEEELSENEDEEDLDDEQDDAQESEEEEY